MPRLSNEFLRKWEDLVEEVDKKDIPVECMKRVVIRLKDGKRRYFNVTALRRQGLEPEDIEIALDHKLAQYDQEVDGVDFFVDVEAVADIVQSDTNEMLSKIKK